MLKLDSGSSDLEINSWFPTLIGVSFYKNHNNVNLLNHGFIGIKKIT
mgnify:CR=1 FL=1